jgi:uncharacterized protein YebE (UPF0316 family)
MVNDGLLFSYLFIFFAKVAHVGLSTVRILILVRGMRFLATVIGFFEAALFVLALKEVFLNTEHIWGVSIYALGVAAGNYVGSFVEERMAVGFVTIQVLSLTCTESITEELRKEGFGVTVIGGCGKDGPHELLNVIVKRKDLVRVLDLVKKMDIYAFVTVMDTKKIVGGYFVKTNKSRRVI